MKIFELFDDRKDRGGRPSQMPKILKPKNRKGVILTITPNPKWEPVMNREDEMYGVSYKSSEGTPWLVAYDELGDYDQSGGYIDVVGEKGHDE